MIITEPKRVNIKGYKNDDCSIIALGNALNISYDLARKILMNGVGIPSQSRVGISSRNKTKEELSDDITIIPILRVISEYKVDLEPTLDTPRKSCKLPGVYIGAIEGHLLSIKDGKVLDIEDNRDEKLEYLYKINEDKAKKVAENFAKHFKMNIYHHIF